MKRFTPSLACFLIVLGQLCLMGEIEINLSVDHCGSSGFHQSKVTHE